MAGISREQELDQSLLQERKLAETIVDSFLENAETLETASKAHL